MKKVRFGLLAALAVLSLLLAACGGGATPAATQPVPGTGATAPGGVATDPAGAAVGTGQCVGVDTAQLTAAGETFYNETCAGCHGQQGEGVGDFPALAGNANVTGDVAALVESYFAVEGHPTTVSPEQLAGALSYVRGAFGNTGEVICPDQITVPVP